MCGRQALVGPCWLAARVSTASAPSAPTTRTGRSGSAVAGSTPKASQRGRAGASTAGRVAGVAAAVAGASSSATSPGWASATSTSISSARRSRAGPDRQAARPGRAPAGPARRPARARPGAARPCSGSGAAARPWTGPTASATSCTEVLREAAAGRTAPRPGRGCPRRPAAGTVGPRGRPYVGRPDWSVDRPEVGGFRHRGVAALPSCPRVGHRMARAALSRRHRRRSGPNTSLRQDKAVVVPGPAVPAPGIPRARVRLGQVVHRLGSPHGADQPLPACPRSPTCPTTCGKRILAGRGEDGFVPNVFLAMAHRPAELRAFLAYHDALMEEEGRLTKAEREMVVVATRRGPALHLLRGRARRDPADAGP